MTKKMKATTGPTMEGNAADQLYDKYLDRMTERLLHNTIGGNEPLFQVSTDGLWQTYLDAIPDQYRQFHTCHECRRFIERYGGLVTIDKQGYTKPAFWNEEDAPDGYKAAVAAIIRKVKVRSVDNVFLSSESRWGTRETGQWHHMSLKPHSCMIFRDRLMTAGQKMAEKLEDHKNMVRALQEFKLSTVETAVSLLDSETLYRGEKVKGPAEWLLELQNALKPIPTNNRWLNRVWLSVATAPAGFCHPRSSMIGTLLEDIAAGKSFDEFSRAFKAKMSPIAYQRPQAAPKAGAILQAEKLFQDLQAASALERRWATLDDLKKLWTPNREVFKAGRQCGKTGAVFAHIKAREEAVSVSSVRAPAINITWVKFADKVLPTANKLEVYVNMSDSFCQFVTEANKESTPILQWDFPEARNPVSWYFYNGRSPAVKFHLSGAQFHSVSAVVLRPSMWGETHMEHWGKGVAFVIPECHDMRGECLALFPESLKSEFHGVRSVIEEHMRSAKLSGDRSTAAAGIGKGQTGPGGKWDLRVRVTSKGHIQEYCLERWD